MKKRQVVVRKRTEVLAKSPISTRSSSTVRYGECQKNHAAGIGGYAVDGCREFMASGGEGTEDALTCAACGCHSNFHLQEVETEVVCEYNPPVTITIVDSSSNRGIETKNTIN